MAGIENIGFALWAQPAHLCLVSVARSIPLRVAHPPPQFSPTESVCRSESAPASNGDVCLDASINCRTAAFPPQSIEETQMQKAHLYEAISLFNHGMDEAVRGLERLKRAPDLDSNTVEKVRVLFEAGRADINSHFCNNLEGAESADAADFNNHVRERRKETLDSVKVYEDVQIIE